MEEDGGVERARGGVVEAADTGDGGGAGAGGEKCKT